MTDRTADIVTEWANQGVNSNGTRTHWNVQSVSL